MQELDEAIAYHEVWKPTAYDADLHARMGTSFASNAFLVVRHALRREMILALMRLWDNDSRAVNLVRVAKALRSALTMEALTIQSTARIGISGVLEMVRTELQQKADAALTLVDRYAVGGSHHHVLKKLRKLRNEQLAHCQLERSPAEEFVAKNEEIEAFLSDMCELMSLLLSVVRGVAYDPKETGNVYRHHASFFWEAARGERTEGHPRYRPAPQGTADA
jgi:AbiU2